MKKKSNINIIVPVPKKSLPRVFRFYKLAKAIVGLQTLLGAALCFLSVWLLAWTPHIRQRDNPYWSGLPVSISKQNDTKMFVTPICLFQLLISGILGLILLCCCRKEYPGMKGGKCIYSTKVTDKSRL